MGNDNLEPGIGGSIAAAQGMLSAVQEASKVALLIIAAVGEIEAKKAVAIGAIEQSKNESLASIRAAIQASMSQLQTADSPAITRPPRHVSVSEE